MNQKQLFQSVLILRDTEAVIYQLATEAAYPTTLKKGHRFDGISSIDDTDELSLLTEAISGTVWAIPCANIFPLTGRFDRATH